MTDAIEVIEGWRSLKPKDDNPRAIGQVRSNSNRMLSSVSIEGVFRSREGRLLSVGDDLLLDVAPGTVRNFEIEFRDAPDGSKGACDLTNVRWDVEDDDDGMVEAIEVLEGWRCLTPKDGNPRAIGQVRNNSDRMLRVSIEGVFRNRKGRLLSVGDDILFDVAPDTVRNFELKFRDAAEGSQGTCDLTHVSWDVEDDAADMTEAIEVLKGWRCLTPKDDNPRAIGQVRNNSDRTLRVRVEGVFRDGEGLLLSVGKDILFDVTPGSTRNFEIDFRSAPDGSKGTCDLTNVRWRGEDD